MVIDKGLQVLRAIVADDENPDEADARYTRDV
jgi:hypothetical protein